MRCRACNDELTDYESTWKDHETGEYYDLCAKCWSISRSAELEAENNFCYNSGLTVVENNEEDS